MERVVHELAKGLIDEGVDVRVFTLNTSRAPQYEEVDGVRIWRAPALQLTRLLGMQSAASPFLLREAWRELRDDPPDLLHAHNRFFCATAVAALISRLIRRPLVTTLHLGSLQSLPRLHCLAAEVYERTMGQGLLSTSERVIAVSEAVATQARHLGVQNGKLRVIPNGVDADRFRPPLHRENGSLRFVFVGRLVLNKGPQFLLEAAVRLLAEVREAEIIFVGDGAASSPSRIAHPRTRTP